MSQIKILIVEDKRIIADAIEAVLSQNGIGVIAVCDSGEGAIQEAKQCEPDLIVMDIELSGKMDGIEAVHIINRERQIPIIYLTDYTDHSTVKRAKSTFPANYLSKPFNDAELVRAIEIACYNANTSRANQSSSPSTEHLFLRDHNHFEKFEYNEILCLKAGRSYCEVITTKKKLIFSTSLNHIHSQLSKRFVRVHRSWVVNSAKITKLEGNMLHLEEIKVPIGREYRDNLVSRLKLIK